MSGSKRTKSGLCCGCGNVKTLSIYYNRGESFAEAGFNGDCEEVVRCIFTAKCPVCNEWTRHASLREGPGADAAELWQIFAALGGPPDPTLAESYHEEVFARYHVERLCDPVRRELAGADEFGPVRGADAS